MHLMKLVPVDFSFSISSLSWLLNLLPTKQRKLILGQTHLSTVSAVDPQWLPLLRNRNKTGTVIKWNHKSSHRHSIKLCNDLLHSTFFSFTFYKKILRNLSKKRTEKIVTVPQHWWLHLQCGSGSREPNQCGSGSWRVFAVTKRWILTWKIYYL